MKKKYCFVWLIAFLWIIIPYLTAHAQTGNIDPSEKYAWSENQGWFNFSSKFGGVTVHDTYLTGFVWSENSGWILLNASDNGPYSNTNLSNWGVNLDKNGLLSGFAWSETSGWIAFNGPHHASAMNLDSGQFSGYIWAENLGYIHLKNENLPYGTTSPRISVHDATILENYPSLDFEITLSHPLTEDVSFEYSTINDTALASIHYSPVHTIAIIPAGHTSLIIPIVLIDNLAEAPNTSFIFKILSGTYVSFNQKTAIGTIVDDESHHIIVANAYGNGEISPKGPIPVKDKVTQVFQIMPFSEHHVSDLHIDGYSMGPFSGTSYRFMTVETDHTIDVYYAIDTYSIRVTAGSYGQLSPTGDITVNSSDSLTLTVLPDTNYHIKNVKIDGISIGAMDPIVLTQIKNNHSVYATFDINQYTIAVSHGPNGMITPSDAFVNHGANQTFIITPEERYHIADVLVDGVSVGPVDHYVFHNVIQSHTIHASFALSTFSISVISSTGGLVDPKGPISLSYGENQTFHMITSRPTYSEECDILDIKIDGQSIGATEWFTFYDVRGNHTLEAKFYCTLKVCENDCYYSRIQNAIDGSRNGDIIRVSPKTYYEQLHLKGKKVRIEAVRSSTPVVVDAQYRASVVTFDQNETLDTSISGIVLRNGNADYGGGIYINGASPLIENCIITDNTAGISGGGIYATGQANPMFRNCKVINNYSRSDGAGVAIESGAEPYFINAYFYNNTADRKGGGLFLYGGSASFYHATIRSNQSFSQGKFVFADNNSWLVFHNSILATDIPEERERLIRSVNSQVNITYSDVWLSDGDYPGTGNINVNPIFQDSFHLASDSPCIDRASINNAPDIDIENHERPQGNSMDMGADEYMNLTPLADFYAQYHIGYAPLYVTFIDASSSSSPITQWVWDFGDGTTQTSNTPQNQFHTYTHPGKYAVTLTIFNSNGEKSVTTYKNSVEVKPKKMVLDFTANLTTGYEPASIIFYPHLNAPEDIQAWEWDFGDGVTATEQIPTHTYTQTGYYTVRLKTTDTENTVNTRIRHDYIQILSRTPKADFWASPVLGNAPLEVYFFDNSVLFEEVTFREWDFGDQHTSNDMEPTHIYATPGIYTVKLTIQTGINTIESIKDNFIQVREGAPSMTVCGGGDCSYTSIQNAINHASNGENILVRRGIYRETISYMGKSITIRAEEGPDNTVIDASLKGSVVQFMNGEQSDAILDGFTLQNGRSASGGGIMIGMGTTQTMASPVIRNCYIIENQAVELGGGIAIVNGAPSIINCKVDRNLARLGGGVGISNFSEPMIQATSISENRADENGGGIYCYNVSPSFSEMIIRQNKAMSKGGGLYIQESKPTQLENLMIVLNEADYGAGIYMKNINSALFSYCTIADNVSGLEGNGILCGLSSILFRNGILWHGGKDIYNEEGCDIRVTYSNVYQEEGGLYPGTQNINLMPRFIAPGNDYHLADDSPCKNIGSIELAPAKDIDGNLRPSGAGYDIGADEAFNVKPFIENQELITDEDRPLSLTLRAVDYEKDALVYIIVTQPSHGQLSGKAPLLLYTPNLDYYGDDHFTYRAFDGFLYSDEANVSIEIRPVNDAPVFYKGKDCVVLEDSGTHTFSNWAWNILSGPDNEKQDVTFILSVQNDPLFSVLPKISPDGTLTFTPAPNANGSSRVSVQLKDDGGTGQFGNDTSDSEDFFISIKPVNDRPSFILGEDIELLEDSPLKDIPGYAASIVPGPMDEYGQNTWFEVMCDKPYLFETQPELSPSGALKFKTLRDAFGEATVSVLMKDDGGTENGGINTSIPAQFRILIRPVNDAPSFVKGTNKTVVEDSGEQRYVNWASEIYPGPMNESDQSLQFILNIDHPEYFIQQPIITSSGTLVFSPADNVSGTARVWVFLQDSGGINENGKDKTEIFEFTITIVGLNDPPSFTKGPDITIYEDDGAQSYEGWATEIYSGPGNEQDQSVTFHVTVVDNPGLFLSLPMITDDGTLSFIPANHANGVVTLSIYLEDSGGDDNNTSEIVQTKITILPVNDMPQFTRGSDIVLLEDSGSQTISPWATQISPGPLDESQQMVTFLIQTNADDSLTFTSMPSVAPNGQLTFSTAPNAYGKAIVTVRLKDNGGTDNNGINTSPPQQFTIEVASVNDVPTFQTGTPPVVLESCGTQRFENWVNKFSAGPDNEKDQLLTFIVSASNKSLFAIQPSVSSEGTLSFKPTDLLFGQSAVEIKIKDSGGIANNGLDVSAPQTFTITVLPVNNSPSFTMGLDQSIFEDSGLHEIKQWASDISPGPMNEIDQTLTFHVTTDNDFLFMQLPDISSNGTLSFVSAPNAFGTARVSVYLKDNGGVLNGGVNVSITRSFILSIISVNDPPTFTPGQSIEIIEDSPPQKIFSWATDIVSGPANENSQNLSFIVDLLNPHLFNELPAIDNYGTLTFSLMPDISGTAIVSVRLKDDGGISNNANDVSAPVDFQIKVLAVNDKPTFIKGPDQTILEDSPAQFINEWATNIRSGPSDEADQTLSFHTSVTNPYIYSQRPMITPEGHLSYAILPDAHGSSIVTLYLKDNGGSEYGGYYISEFQQITITVLPVNDMPNFDKGEDIIVNEDCGKTSIPNWASNITQGAPFETNQDLEFVLWTNNTILFPQMPTITTLGEMIFTPAPDQFGTAVFSVFLKDTGGVDNNGVDRNPSQTIKITVLPVNDPPTFVLGTSLDIPEDAGAQTIKGWASQIRSGPDNEITQGIEFDVRANDSRLFLVPPSISVDGTLTFTPADDVTGDTVVEVRLKDSGNQDNNGQNVSLPSFFTIRILQVNDRPSFTKGPDQEILEDAVPQMIYNWASNIQAGPDDESGQPMTFLIETNNDDLFDGSPVITSNGNLMYTPVHDAYGSATITVRLRDHSGTDNNGLDTSFPQYFIIKIIPVNDAPLFMNGPNIKVFEDCGPQRFFQWASQISAGPNEAHQTATFEVQIKHVQANLPPGVLSLFDENPAISPDGTLTFTPEKDVFGMAVITIVLKDSGNTSHNGLNISTLHECSIQIDNVNDPPSFAKGNDLIIKEDSGPQVHTNWATLISPGPGNENNQNVEFILDTNNPNLFLSGPVISSSGTLAYTPAPNMNGSATVSVWLKDNGGTANQGKNVGLPSKFTISILSVNDSPFFELASTSLIVKEDAGYKRYPGWAGNISKGALNELDQILRFRLIVSKPYLFKEQPAINPEGTLSFQTADNIFGDLTISVSLEDNGGISNGGMDTCATIQSFSISIVPVNDPPNFVPGDHQRIFENKGPQSIPNWARYLSPGPSNEAEQTLSFYVETNNTDLFLEMPKVLSNGTLSYNPKPNANGSATVKVYLKDNGGTDNGGIDFSPTYTFSISILPVNNPPQFSLGPDQNIVEDSGMQVIPHWAINIDPGAPNETNQSLTFHIRTNEPNFFQYGPSVTSDGTLSYLTSPDIFGEAQVYIYLEDSGGIENGGDNTSESYQFKITILPVNDKPDFDRGPDQVILENSGTQVIPNWATNITTGSVYEANQTIQFYVISNNDSLFDQLPSILPNGSLSFKPASQMNGSATLTVFAEDNGGTNQGGENRSEVKWFTISVVPENELPTFQKGSDQVIFEDSGLQSIANWATQITPVPDSSTSSNLSFVVTSLKPELFALQPAVSVNGRLTFSPATHAFGACLVNIYLKNNDPSASANNRMSITRQFMITILPVNDAPSCTPGSDPQTYEDAAYQVIPGWVTQIRSGPDNEKDQQVQFILETNHADLFSQGPTISSDGTLSYMPKKDQFGTASVFASIKDSGGIENNGHDTGPTFQFTIKILSVNDAPQFTPGADVVVLEDSGNQVIQSWATQIQSEPIHDPSQVLTFYAEPDRPQLFSMQPVISRDGTLTFTPLINANGACTVRVYLKDNAGTENNGKDTSIAHFLKITITPINDAPSFQCGSDLSTLEDAGQQQVYNYIHQINAGAANETWQTLTFHATTPQYALFSEQPKVDSQGKLTWTSAPNANGIAIITLYLEDNGGESNGGQSKSESCQFNLTIRPVNDPPMNQSIRQQVIGSPVPEGQLTAVIDTWHDAIDWHTYTQDNLSFEYQWQRTENPYNGSSILDILNAINSYYTVHINDYNDFIRVKVTVTDTGIGAPDHLQVIAYSDFIKIGQLPGDLDRNGILDLKDIIVGLQVLSSIETNGSGLSMHASDVDGNAKIDLFELMYLIYIESNR